MNEAKVLKKSEGYYDFMGVEIYRPLHFTGTYRIAQYIVHSRSESGWYSERKFKTLKAACAYIANEGK